MVLEIKLPSFGVQVVLEVLGGLGCKVVVFTLWYFAACLRQYFPAGWGCTFLQIPTTQVVLDAAFVSFEMPRRWRGTGYC